MLHIIHLGAGVQSTAMALAAGKELIEPMPDAAIFADTGWEPKGVYDNIQRLTETLPFPVEIVSRGVKIQDTITGAPRPDGGDPAVSIIPFFSADGGMCRRQCTREFKLSPLHKRTRALAGLKPGERSKGPVVTAWIGISTDEATRMKPPTEKWMLHRYPLTMELGWSRAACMKFLEDIGWGIPTRSACIGCPFHSNNHWEDMKRNDPASFEEACRYDDYLRNSVPNRRNELYMHPSRRPLREVEFKSERQQDFFDNECTGMCGV